jgi:NADH-quinone oxidoreductase subunit C
MSRPLSDRLKARFPDAVTIPESAAVPETVCVAPAALRDVCLFCKDDEAMELQALSCLTGVDYRDRIELVYHLISYRRSHELILKVRLDRAQPRVQTVEGVWKTANWHERECFDLLGVSFEGHPDLRRLLLPEDWVGHPLRKDYQAPTEYHGISHRRADPLRPSAPECSQPQGGEVARAD